jgi:hypothetical protein
LRQGSRAACTTLGLSDPPERSGKIFVTPLSGRNLRAISCGDITFSDLAREVLFAQV